MNVELTDHQCDLIGRLLSFVLNECKEELRTTRRLETVAITWLRDDVIALVPLFVGALPQEKAL